MDIVPLFGRLDAGDNVARQCQEPAACQVCSHAPWPCYRPRVGTNPSQTSSTFLQSSFVPATLKMQSMPFCSHQPSPRGRRNGCRPEGDARVGPVSANVPNQVAQMWAYPDAARRLTGTPEPHPQGGDCPPLSLRQPRPASPTEIAPEVTGHGLPPSKCEAYDRVYDEPFGLH